MTRPSAREVADRALVLYAVSRRAAIELALEEFGDDPHRVAQAERARVETDRWLARESLDGALTDVERHLLSAPSGSWPREAVIDGMWRKEAMGVCLWSLRHVAALPPAGDEFEVAVLNERIERYGSVSSFRANGSIRPEGEVEAAGRESDAWLAATEGRGGQDATLASISAERVRAFSWLLDGDAGPA
jgi:uncharacterized protein DUF4272